MDRWMMRAIAQHAFGKVAISTKYLKAGWIAVALYPLVHLGLAHHTPMRCPIIVDMVKLKKRYLSFTTTHTTRATISIQYINLGSLRFAASALYALLARLVPINAGIATCTQAGSQVIRSLFAALLFAYIASMRSCRWATAYLAMTARYALCIGHTLTLDTSRTLKALCIARATTACTEAGGAISVTPGLFDGITFFSGLTAHCSNLRQYYSIPYQMCTNMERYAHRLEYRYDAAAYQRLIGRAA